MMIDPLEKRVLLTAILLPDGTLDITSSWYADNYTITMDGTNITVAIAVEGFNAQYPRSAVQRINLHDPEGDPPGQGLGNIITVTDPFSVGNPARGIPITIDSSIYDDLITITGSGAASITSNQGSDTIFGGEGDDTIRGGGGRTQNTTQGVSEGDDIIYGGAGNDQLFGEGGGGGGDNRIGDILIGGTGNDTLTGGDGRDLLDGGAGTDWVSYADQNADVEVYFPALINPAFDPLAPLEFDNYPVIGNGEVNNNRVQQEHDQYYVGLDTLGFGTTPYNPLQDYRSEFYTPAVAALLGNGSFEAIDGGNSAGGPIDDVIDVSLATGHDWTVRGNNGIDNILGSPGNDSLDGGDGQDFIDGNAGDDVILGGAGSDFLVGDDQFGLTTGSDTLFGDAGVDTIWGCNGNDVLDGGANADLLVGDLGQGNADTAAGSGNDTLVGGVAGGNGAGADTLQGDGGIDTADYSMRTEGILITFDTVHDDGAPGESDFVTESTEIGLGGSGNDKMDGRTDNRARTLNGGAGDDTLVSGTGPEQIIGGDGRDTVDYSSRTNPITVTFDGVANDGDPLLNNGGPAGENDNVDISIETVLTIDGPGGGGGGGEDVVPLAPSNLAGSALSYNSVKLQWRDNATNEDGYLVYRRAKSDPNYTIVAHLASNVRHYTDTGLEPETVYVYRVRAFNDVGNSPFSDFIQVKTKAVAAVAAASGLTASAYSSSRIDLVWKDNSNNESSFEIWRMEGTSNIWDIVGTNPANDRTYSDTGLSPSTQYSYRVRAVNEFRVAGYSNTAKATTRDVNFIVAPSNLTAVRHDDGSIELNWKDNSDNELGFSVERAVMGVGVFEEIFRPGANITNFFDSDVEEGVVYLYRVEAFRGGDTSDFSNVASPDMNVALGAPTRFEAQAIAPDQVRLTWRDVAAIETKYIIERGINGTTEFQVIGQVGANVESFTDTGLLPKTKYIYRVRGTDGTNFSSYSRTATATTLELLQTLPDAPSAIKARAVSNTSVRLDWRDNSNDETNFVIERANSLDGPFAIVDTIGRNRVRYVDEGLDPGTTYYYRVRARNGTISSEPTRIVRITTPQPAVVTTGAVSQAAAENGSPVVFIVSRKGDTTGDLVVQYTLTGTAANGVDYTPNGGSVTIPNGTNSAFVTLPVVDDAISDPIETVTLTAIKAAGYKVSPSRASATATIADDELVFSRLAPAPRFSGTVIPGGDADDENPLIGLI